MNIQNAAYQNVLSNGQPSFGGIGVNNYTKDLIGPATSPQAYPGPIDSSGYNFTDYN